MSGFGIAVDAEPRKDASGKVISSPSLADARACVARLRVLFPGHPVGGYLPRWYWGDRATDFCDWLWASHYVTGGPASPQALYGKVPAELVGRVRRPAHLAPAVHRQGADPRRARPV